MSKRVVLALTFAVALGVTALGISGNAKAHGGYNNCGYGGYGGYGYGNYVAYYSVPTYYPASPYSYGIYGRPRLAYYSGYPVGGRGYGYRGDHGHHGHHGHGSGVYFSIGF